MQIVIDQDQCSELTVFPEVTPNNDGVHGDATV